MGVGSLEGLRRYEEDTQIQIREIRDSLEDMKREVRNHNLELKAFEERNHSVDSSLDAIRQELKETHQAQKEINKNNIGSLEMKIGSLETNSKGLNADVKQIRTTFNESQDTLKQFKDRISHLEKTIEAINRNVEHLEQALGQVLDAYRVEAGQSPTGSTGTKTYKVISGDSLEKIARKTNVDIKTLRRLNNLSSDQIRIGQTLKLTE
jgi:LysM repeat protein